MGAGSFLFERTRVKLLAGVTSYLKQLELASLEYHLQSASSCRIHYHYLTKGFIPQQRLAQVRCKHRGGREDSLVFTVLFEQHIIGP